MSSTIKRRRLATALRSLRERSGLTLDDVAERMGLARSTMSRIETARAGARPAIVRGLLTIYDVHGDEAEVIVQIAKDASHRGWWYPYRDVVPEWFQPFVGFETEAARIEAYEARLVPGLLQTERYARAVLDRPWRRPSAEMVERCVRFRLARQQVLRDQPRIDYRVVLGETALHCQPGSPQVQREQLDHLLATIEHRMASIQILPAEAGPATGEHGPFVLLTFPAPEDPPVCYVEYLTGAELIEDPDDIETYRAAIEHQRSMALSEQESAELIAAVAAKLPS